MNRTLIGIGSALVGAVIGALLFQPFNRPTPPPLATTTPIDCAAPRVHCIKVFFYNDVKKVHVNNTHLYKTGQSTRIYWFFDNSVKSVNTSYKFASNGIAFSDDDGRNEFTCAPDASGMVFSCVDLDGKPADEQEGYKYKVTVTDGTSSASQDPRVINY